MNLTVKVSAPVHDTELEEKVKTAVTNLFPLELHLKNSGITGEGDIESLRTLHMRLREQKILDTARHVLLTGVEGNGTGFHLNKQAACAGKVNFSEGNESLGSICVEITAGNKEELMKTVDWLAPRTIEGKPVEEIEL